MINIPRRTALLLGWTLLLSRSPVLASPPDRTLVQWNFDRERDLQHWVPNGQITDVKVTGDGLHFRATGGDPILELSSLLDLPATPWQAIEVRLRASRDGTAELFWSNTSQGRFGGFSQEKTTRLPIRGDSQWRTYRVLPFWHPEQRIVRLRFDVYDGTAFDIAFMRIVETVMPPPTAKADFKLSRGGHDWQAINGAIVSPGTDALIARFPEDGLLLAPPVSILAEEGQYAVIRMAVDKGQHGTLFFATENTAGLHGLNFPINPDGRERTYNVDMLTSRDWKGRVIAMGLRGSDDPAARTVIVELNIGDRPGGPAQLKVLSFTCEDALPRVGVPTTRRAVVTNTGGMKSTEVRTRLSLPAGVRLIVASPAASRLKGLKFGEDVVLTWKIQASRPVTADALLEVVDKDAPAGSSGLVSQALAKLSFTPRLSIERMGEIPEPEPVRGPFEVGAYYFPGWKAGSQWEPIRRFPERRPVLGWYREGSLEVADWQIKWAVEHGITFFAYDWYWSQGGRQLEHALHDGYFKARYRHLLKFCLLWANHNPPGTSSQEDCLAVTRYWIKNYFRRPEHLTVAGKPVVIIFSPHRFSEDLGTDGVKKAFAAMRAECLQAGLNGLHLIACVGDTAGARRAGDEGYDAVTAYNWPGLGMKGGGMYAPYASLVEGYNRQWRELLGQASPPLSPLPINGGWDSRPWHGDNDLVRFGRTPDLFRRHLADARRLMEEKKPGASDGNMVIIEAWNEWGEGSYIEPHQEFGFGYLDAIREVFTAAPKAHQDVTPADVRLGPYDVSADPPLRTQWEFTQDPEGWTAMMGLDGDHLVEGSLAAHTTSNDPALVSPPLQARASEFTAVAFRLKLERTDGRPFQDVAQIFWQTRQSSESEAASEGVQVAGDGKWHEYRITVSKNRRWRGIVTRLRFDPCNRPDVRMTLDFLRLEH